MMPRLPCLLKRRVDAAIVGGGKVILMLLSQLRIGVLHCPVDIVNTDCREVTRPNQFPIERKCLVVFVDARPKRRSSMRA